MSEVKNDEEIKDKKIVSSSETLSESSTEVKLYTLDEVKIHNSKDDCWIIIGDYVYDVTKFLDLHPGGSSIITMYAGTDCTGEFEDIFHSLEAEKLMDQYLVGKYNRNRQ